MTEREDRWAAVAAAVTKRMTQVGLKNQADLRRRSGLAAPTARQYMTGKPGRRGGELPASPRDDTRQPLAHALMWREDWWERIISGQEPRTYEDDPPNYVIVKSGGRVLTNADFTRPSEDEAARIQLDEALRGLGERLAAMRDQDDEQARQLALLADRVHQLERRVEQLEPPRSPQDTMPAR